MHVQPGKAAPRTADHIKGQASLYRKGVFAHRLGNIIAQYLRDLLGRFSGQYVMPQCAQRQRHPRAQFAIGYADKFKAAAAQIADIAIGKRIIAQYAMARRCGLSIAVQHIDADAQSGGLIDQFLTVFRFTRCGGGDHAHAVDLHRAGQRFKAGQGGQRLFHRRFVNLAIACEARTQFYPAFFIVNGQGRARRACIYHEPDSVGANINDGLTHRLHLCRTRLKVGTFLSSASAPPRPESDALVMK